MNRLYSTTLRLQALKLGSSLLRRTIGNPYSVQRVSSQFYCSGSPAEDLAALSDYPVDKDRGTAESKERQKPSEGISDRLKRLSMDSPQEFIPSDTMEVIEKQRWARYSKYFPDQKIRAHRAPGAPGEFRSEGFSKPHSGFKQHSYQNPNRQSFDRYERDSFHQNQRNSYQNHQRSSYPNQRGFQGNQQRGPSRYESEDYESSFDDRRGPPPRRHQKPNRFSYDEAEDEYENEYEDELEEVYRSRPNRAVQNKSNRNQRSIQEDEGDDRRRIDVRKMKQEYDLADDELLDEPVRSSRIQFNNSDNLSAIKEAYTRRFKADAEEVGRRKFHTFTALRNLVQDEDSKTSSSNPLSSLSSFSLVNKKEFSSSRAELSKVRSKDINRFGKTNPSSSEDPNLPEDDDSELFGTLGMSGTESQTRRSEHLLQEALSGGDSLVNSSEDLGFKSEDRMNMKKLEYRVKVLLDENKLPEALDLFTDSLKEGGFGYTLKQLSYLYRILISACGLVGYKQEAFKLHRDMKARGVIVSPGVYTSLFNACANSPWLGQKNIASMDRLRAIMIEKGYQPNLKNYNAMIKGYGRCGDIEKACAVVDEMLEREKEESAGLRPNKDTFCFLLQACISDKANGFRNALVIWEKMYSRKVKHIPHTYHLLLKATRECGISIPPDIQAQIDRKNARLNQVRAELLAADQLDLLAETKEAYVPAVEQTKYLLSSSMTENSLARIKTTLDAVSAKQGQHFSTSVLISGAERSKVAPLGQLTDAELDVIERLSLPHYRLLMLGGMRGLLHQMKIRKVTPDIRVLQELLMVVQPEEALDVMRLVQAYKITPDVQLLNVLVRKLVFLNNPEETKKAMQLFNDFHLSPDIYTWSALAMACRFESEAKQLLADMDAAGFTPNEEVMGALFSRACKQFEPGYILMLMSETLERDLSYTPKTLQQLEDFRKSVNQSIVQSEKGEVVTSLRVAHRLKNKREEFLEEWKAFKMSYNPLLKGASVVTEPQDPWAQDFAKRKGRRNKGLEPLEAVAGESN